MPISKDTRLGLNVVIYHESLVNIYGAEIGDDTKIGAFVEIQSGVVIGSKCKIQSHSFICEGVMIEDEVFVGHGVMFTNDRYPRSTTTDGMMKGRDAWTCLNTCVGRRASIGSGAVVLPGVTIGRNAMIGGGAVVTRNVPDFAIVVGNPARVIGDIRDTEEA